MSSAFDAQMMELALQLAARGTPSPNPHVGAVVVQGREVLATGYHRRAGEAHAEIDALRKLEQARGTTLYVTLEPCAHHGRTGPCAHALLAAGVARVVIGCEDPIAEHAGGAALLRAAGVAVELGVKREEAERLIADFRKHALCGLPYLTVRGALPAGGATEPRDAYSAWLTPAARRHAARLRAGADAILIGAGSVLAHDPPPAARFDPVAQRPAHVILDSALRVPEGAQLIAAAHAQPVWVVHAERAPLERRRALLARGVRLLEAPAAADGVELEPVLRLLAREGVVRLLAECGPRLQRALLERGFVDAVELLTHERATDAPLCAAACACGARGLKLRAQQRRRVGSAMLVSAGVQGGA